MIRITLSIVSHGQSNLIADLLEDLRVLAPIDIEVVVTINIPEKWPVLLEFPFPVFFVSNETPMGFGANHNAAFRQASSQWFAVVNPDVRIKTFDLQALLAPFHNEAVAAVAPVVLSGEGKVEDSARRFPTFIRLAKRIILKQREADYSVEVVPYPVDWVAGMFVVFRRSAYQQVGGFDERRFFMYLEDADICLRLRKNGWHVLVNPAVQIIHIAQRASRRNIKHLGWHLASAFRYLTGL